ncbi:MULTISPECIES: recombinase family protein [unclassified Sphingobium]|uniref:recombinase family protein n=1 Tax=unclassified Sphingobium TaxID=2611147 RepID=UPI000D156BCF|nr:MULTISPECIES: recombinase family protein [unclassified Sphingobium]MBG6118536.1 DNA invertase Pin-like site-specific DNA recombinase [Sphingobium sp. JAI105]PSO10117.1 resolvase [Sphingobium sp. AEW4]TWC98755.1 DNA invertase Pin-like site-specific DNA recombinase [Sphingobium sp. AEW010]TWD18345.1 DNA invertase Pin-like site-specific DNA recombinase [Sphingobium sp. AEW013]TWD21011.1 DNA invertase Pin-like site-specific DNA recombinase [Sphingobium sp. AEW001]
MNLVVYLRVSTQAQGRSGLSIEAQRAAVEGYALGGGHRVVAEYVEVESGKRDERPVLIEALAACRLHRATLCIAKLDRLSRSVSFISRLHDGDVDFVACDAPYANRFMINLFAAIAEHEREMISQRTKAALAAAKARGVRLGNPNGAAALLPGCKVAAAKAGAMLAQKADQRAIQVLPLIRQLEADGCTSARAMAHALNLRGVPAPSGRPLWYPEQVRRVMRRGASLERTE